MRQPPAGPTRGEFGRVPADLLLLVGSGRPRRAASWTRVSRVARATPSRGCRAGTAGTRTASSRRRRPRSRRRDVVRVGDLLAALGAAVVVRLGQAREALAEQRKEEYDAEEDAQAVVSQPASTLHRRSRPNAVSRRARSRRSPGRRRTSPARRRALHQAVIRLARLRRQPAAATRQPPRRVTNTMSDPISTLASVPYTSVLTTESAADRSASSTPSSHDAVDDFSISWRAWSVSSAHAAAPSPAVIAAWNDPPLQPHRRRRGRPRTPRDRPKTHGPRQRSIDRLRSSRHTRGRGDAMDGHFRCGLAIGCARGFCRPPTPHPTVGSCGREPGRGPHRGAGHDVGREVTSRPHPVEPDRCRHCQQHRRDDRKTPVLAATTGAETARRMRRGERRRAPAPARWRQPNRSQPTWSDPPPTPWRARWPAPLRGRSRSSPATLPAAPRARDAHRRHARHPQPPAGRRRSDHGHDLACRSRGLRCEAPQGDPVTERNQRSPHVRVLPTPHASSTLPLQRRRERRAAGQAAPMTAGRRPGSSPMHGDECPERAHERTSMHHAFVEDRVVRR